MKKYASDLVNRLNYNIGLKITTANTEQWHGPGEGVVRCRRRRSSVKPNYISICEGVSNEGNIDATSSKLPKCDRGSPRTWATLNSHYNPVS